MKLLKIIAKTLLVLVIVSTGLRIAVATFGLVAAGTDIARESPRLFGSIVGAIVGQLIVLVLCIWGFRKIRVRAPSRATGANV